jgi:hypothetical protein
LIGLKGREKFDNDARQLQLVENKTWEYITNRLRSWDREEEVVNKNKASASPLISSSQDTNFCSLGKLNSAVGAPKC